MRKLVTPTAIHCPRCVGINLTMAADANAVTTCQCNDCGTEFTLSPPFVPQDWGAQTRHTE